MYVNAYKRLNLSLKFKYSSQRLFSLIQTPAAVIIIVVVLIIFCFYIIPVLLLFSSKPQLYGKINTSLHTYSRTHTSTQKRLLGFRWLMCVCKCEREFVCYSVVLRDFRFQLVVVVACCSLIFLYFMLKTCLRLIFCEGMQNM